MPRFGGEIGEDKAGTHIHGGNRNGKTPKVKLVPGCRLRATEGGLNWHGNGSRCRNVEQGAGTSGGGWRAAVVGAVQVGGASHRERRWGTGEIERFLKRNGYGWGGGRK